MRLAWSWPLPIIIGVQDRSALGMQFQAITQCSTVLSHTHVYSFEEFQLCGDKESAEASAGKMPCMGLATKIEGHSTESIEGGCGI